MKKTIAFLTAITAALSLFAGCGKIDPAESGTSESKPFSINSNDEEESPTEAEEETDEVDDVEPTDLPSAADKETYLALMDDLLNAARSVNIEKMMHMTLPDHIAESLVKTGIYDYAYNDAAENFSEEVEDIPIVDIRVIEIRDADDDAKELAEMFYTVVEKLVLKVEELGLTAANFENSDFDDLTEEQLAELSEVIELYADIYSADVEPTVKFDDYKYVTFDVEDVEEVVPMFRVKGEKEYKFGDLFADWCIGYVKSSKEERAKADAKTLMIAFNSALCDLDEQGIDLDGTVIVSSDKSKNICGTGNDAAVDRLYEYLGSYIEYEKYEDYFVVIHDSVCIYTAAASKEKVGTYPPAYILTDPEDTSSMEKLDDGATLDEVYKQVVDNIIKR